MRLLLIIFLLNLLSSSIYAQEINCAVYEVDSPCYQACGFYANAMDAGQGTLLSQFYFEKATKLCPTFAEAYAEQSVAFLKRGDFIRWKQLIDKAVMLKPEKFLCDRASGRFKFLHDYYGAISDINQLYMLNKDQVYYTPNGDYDMMIVLGLSLREVGKIKDALRVLDRCIEISELHNRVGMYDYLHRGVTKLHKNNCNGAQKDFRRQIKLNPLLADTYYYLGLTYKQQKRYDMARKQFIIARTKFARGYGRHDPYGNSLDAVCFDMIENCIYKK